MKLKKYKGFTVSHFDIQEVINPIKKETKATAIIMFLVSKEGLSSNIEFLILKSLAFRPLLANYGLWFRLLTFESDKRLLGP